MRGDFMKAFLCRWPNGDCSVVVANDRTHADSLLDEVDNPDRAELFELKKSFAIHFRLQTPTPEDGIEAALTLDDQAFSEGLGDELGRVYPILNEVLTREDATQEMVEEAVEQEKNPIYDKKPALSSDPRAAAVQTELEMPRSVAERLAHMSDEDKEDEESSN
jgi:hypothetical protein